MQMVGEKYLRVALSTRDNVSIIQQFHDRWSERQESANVSTPAADTGACVKPQLEQDIGLCLFVECFTGTFVLVNFT